MTRLPTRLTVSLAAGALFAAAAPTIARADTKTECISASEKAQSLRDDRKFLEARQQLLVCGRDVCPGPVKRDCADQLSQIDARTPSIVLRAKGKHGEDLVAVKVTSDGAPLTDKIDGRSISIDPGVHTLHFEAQGNEPVDQKLVVAEGEHDRIVSVSFGGGAVAAPAGPGTAPVGVTVEKKGLPIGALVVGGIGIVAAGVVAPIFYVMGLDQKSADQAPTGCQFTGGCSQSEIDSIRSKLVVGDIFMGVGVAAVIGGTIWAIVHYTGGHKEAATPPAAAFGVAPAAMGRGAVASATLRF